VPWCCGGAVVDIGTDDTRWQPLESECLIGFGKDSLGLGRVNGLPAAQEKGGYMPPLHPS
jgi:hypothetical protein